MIEVVATIHNKGRKVVHTVASQKVSASGLRVAIKKMDDFYHDYGYRVDQLDFVITINGKEVADATLDTLRNHDTVQGYSGFNTKKVEAFFASL